MSCRLLSPDDPRIPAPVVWPAAHEAAAPADQPLAPDPSAEAALRERQFEQELRAARDAAYREGETAGRNRASADMQPVLERLTATITEMAGLRARLRREAEADMLQLALAIARRVLRRELAIDPEALHGLVLAALEKLDLREIARVRLHPAQAAAVSALLRQAGAGPAVEVAPDPTLDKGAAVFETARGSLDASVETQLQEIERGLADCLRRSS